MAVSWNEAVNGDLSNDISDPTALGTVSQGDNIITGALLESSEDNLDEFSFATGRLPPHSTVTGASQRSERLAHLKRALWANGTG